MGARTVINERMQRIRRILVVLLMSVFLLPCVYATESLQKIYVSPAGDDKQGKGTLVLPYATISHALKFVKPGSHIILRKGRYTEKVTVAGISGTIDAPIVIQAYQNEHVSFDGTDLIDSTWVKGKGGIWSTQVSKPVWQLFIDGQQQVPARWPNARFDDDTIYSESVWSKASVADSPNGLITDDPSHHDLSSLPLDLTGGLLVANVGSFFTWTRDILSHTAGEGKITYAKAPWVKKKHYKYFVEGKLGLLDTPTEWFYKPTSQRIYSMPVAGNPNNLSISAKVRSHSFDVKNWAFVEFTNIHFNAAPIQCINCNHVQLNNLKFDYAGVSRRMLGESDVTADMIRLTSKNEGHFAVRNCEIRDTDSQAIVVHGNHSIVENNLFENTDYAVTQTVTPSSDIALAGDNVVFRYNTIVNSGNSATIALAASKVEGRRQGHSLIAEYNDISKTGFAQTDGSALQVHIPAQNGAVVRYNWIHDTTKMGIRFDAPIPATRWGKYGLVHNNVLWNTGGMMIKGTDHYIYNNTILDTIEVHDLVILDDQITPQLIKRKNIKPGTIIGGKNVRTETMNNIASKISGHRRKLLPLPGIAKSNIDLSKPQVLLSDAFVNSKQRDFRWKYAKSTQRPQRVAHGKILDKINYFGAYPSGDSNHYWVPGRRVERASHPIPKDNTVISTGLVDLIWKPAYDKTKEKLFIAYNKQVLEQARVPEGFAVYEGNESNVWLAKGELHSDMYWRVDSLVDGQWVKGDIWSVLKK